MNTKEKKELKSKFNWNSITIDVYYDLLNLIYLKYNEFDSHLIFQFSSNHLLIVIIHTILCA